MGALPEEILAEETTKSKSEITQSALRLCCNVEEGGQQLKSNIYRLLTLSDWLHKIKSSASSSADNLSQS